MAEWFGEAPANTKSCALTAAKDHCEIYHADDEAFFDQIYVLEDAPSRTAATTRDGLQDLRRMGPGLDRSEGVIWKQLA